MDNVVKIEDAGAKRRARGSTATKRRKPGSKTALVLGGGGMTGGVYEIGALRALDLLSVNKTVNQFDVYVGTSAGSFVAAMTANGVTPEEMMRVVVQETPVPFRDVDVGTMMRPNWRDFILRSATMPIRLAGVVREMASNLGNVSAMDFFVGLAEALPPGMYSGSGIEEYVREVLGDPDRSDDFRQLERELYIAATDLDSCERVVLGSQGWDDIPISTAVRASTALPMVYRPVELRGRELVDGGIVSTTNLDIAVEAGAKFIIVVNPLVPYVNDMDAPRADGGDRLRVSEMGFPHIGYQTFKLLAYQRLHEMKRQWEDRYPGVDIVLIEPEPDDELMFRTSVMNFTSRLEIARHGFQSVTLKLADDYEAFKRTASKHGVEISATRVRKVVKHFTAEQERTRAWRRILEQTTATLLRQSADERA
ncbi:MAG: patatin-like phospholipase family protein [Actinomycetes bacterium]